MPRPDSPKKVDADQLLAWLPLTVKRKQRYGHLLAAENAAKRSEILAELREFFGDAHGDAKWRLAKALRPSLSPFSTAKADARPGYPHKLHFTVKKGYFREVMAGLLAEHAKLHKQPSWTVPLFLFRFHDAAFQQLERMDMDLNAPDKPVPGRTGDDCLAFIKSKGRVTRILVCESKCLKKHRKDRVTEAHEKISETVALSNRPRIDVLT